MHEGLNYITMRDGIQLAATVRYPYGSDLLAPPAPCPTVIEYSGYDAPGPTDPIPSLLARPWAPVHRLRRPEPPPRLRHRRRARSWPGWPASPR